MLKVFAFLTKKEDLETQAFIDYYENNHLPLIRSLAPPPIVYKRNYLMRGHELNMEDSAINFDVVTEMVFPDQAAYLACSAAVGTGDTGALVAADEMKFLNRSGTRIYVIEEHVTAL